jgi:hypothetical protein
MSYSCFGIRVSIEGNGNCKELNLHMNYSCFGIRVSIKGNGNCKELISCRPILSWENVGMSTKRYIKTTTKSDPDKEKQKQRKFPSFIFTVTRFYSWYELFSFPTSLSCILNWDIFIGHPCPHLPVFSDFFPK